MAVLVVTGLFVFNDTTLHSKKILLGTSLPLSGINAHLGHDIVIGANAYFSHANAKGGVRGKIIELISYDDKYEPENTWSNTLTLLNKDDVFALFGFVGTPTVKRILPLINESAIPFIAPYTGASFLRTGNESNIVNFRSSYEEETDALVRYLTTERNISRFAIFIKTTTTGKKAT